jgi:hypothetical protein
MISINWKRVSGINLLRNKLDSSASRSLTEHKGELLLLQKGEKTMLVSASVKRVRYMWGFIPLYQISDGGWAKLSITTDILEPITNIILKLRTVVKDHPKAVWKVVITNMLGYLSQGLDNIQQESIAKITSSYASFHDKFLANVISKSQNDYRQQLSDVIRTTGSETLSSNIKKHLAMLLLKMREVEQQRIQTDYVSSGPLALPNGCKFVFRRKNVSVYVVEQLPQARTISYLEEKFRISLPYIVFMATIKDNSFLWLQVLFRKSSLRNETDELLCPALPNIQDSGRARFGVCFPGPKNRNVEHARIVDEAIQNFWGSDFNKDLSAFWNTASSQFPQLHSFEDWQMNTSKDPLFALNLMWQSANTDVSSHANNMLDNALNIGSGNPEQNTLSTLQEYASTLGDKFSREITEKIHFMVSHSHIKVDSLASAQEQLRKLVNGTANDLKAKVNGLFSTPITDADLDRLCKEARLKLGEEVEATCSQPISEIINKINQI